MDPLDSSSFELKSITLGTGRKYEYCDQTPAEYKHGETPILLLLHGFPEFWYEWRYQIGPWFRRGWRIVVPNMLGYHGTDKPDDPALYTSLALAGDIAGFLDGIDIKHPIVVVSHDWGAVTGWSFATRYPERTRALVALSVPHQAPLPMEFTIPQVIEAMGSSWLGYWYFFTSEDGHTKIEANIPLFIDLLYRSHKTVHPELWGVGTIEKIMSGEIANPGPSDVMSEKERQSYIKYFEANGIDKPLNYYRQFPHAFAIQEKLKLNPILPTTMPVLLVAPDHEPFVHPDLVEKSKHFVPSLEVQPIESAHFVLLERRDEITQIVGDWVEKALNRAK
ncbi:hypothetical protein FRB95_009039 [Tulasnella sp. JGI-2019a]|nr:hypothetical protein FRB95_009039 [Tulasnella sp. JGI-2019a]